MLIVSNGFLLFHLAFYFLYFLTRATTRATLNFIFWPLPNIFSIQKFPQKLFNLLRAKCYANCLKWLSRYFFRKFNFNFFLKMEIIFNFQHPSQNPLLLKFCRINKYTLMHLLIFELFHLVFDSETSFMVAFMVAFKKLYFYLILTYSYYFLGPKLSSTMF